jgi:hypothetical protein
MDKEMWKVIPNTNDMYYVSSFGRVYSKKTNKLRKLYSDNKGYLQVDYVNVQGKRITRKVHRLVAELFVPGQSPSLVVNHKDGVKTNNLVDNLEWVTPQQNTIHMLVNNLKTKFPNNLPNKAQKVLCVELGVIYNSLQDASKTLGIHQSNITKVCQGTRKTAGGYTWQYIKED